MSKRFNVILMLLLIASILTAAFVGISFFNSSKSVTVPDFVGQNSSQVYAWCGNLPPQYGCEFEKERSDTYELDKIISQSVKAGEKLKDKIAFKISNGISQQIKVIEVTDSLSKADVEAWAKENGLEKVTYLEEESTLVKDGYVIRIEPADTIRSDETLKVYIAKRSGGSSQNNIEIKAGEYVGLSEDRFKSTATSLGLSPVHDDSLDAHSDSISKGNVVWHGSGSYVKNEKIRYGLSLGKNVSGSDIQIVSGKYVGLTVTDFKEKMADLGLDAYHDEDVDDYSDSVTRGFIVWHGSGYYEKGEKIRYGLSLGKKDGSSSDDDTIYVSTGQYVGKSATDFESATTKLGLSPYHDPDKDDYSDTVAKGLVVWHGSGDYEKNEKIRYGLSLGKKDGGSSDGTITISLGQYVGKTPTDFESATKKLGLSPYHDSDKDAYSDSITKDLVVWHGSGEYEKGEKIRYGLSLGKKDGSSSDGTITVSLGQYVGKTSADFESITGKLGLSPYHDSGKDAYSDSITKGLVVWHGSGEYEKGEKIRYGLSLGKKSGSATINVPSYQGSSEKTFLEFLSANGLLAGERREQYSNEVASGCIIANDTGAMAKGDTVDYIVSLGPESEDIIYMNHISDIANEIQSTNDYEGAVKKLKAYFDRAGFTNYTILGSSSRDDGVGTLMSITVDGKKHVTRAAYAANAKITAVICNSVEAG